MKLFIAVQLWIQIVSVASIICTLWNKERQPATGELSPIRVELLKLIFSAGFGIWAAWLLWA